MNSKQKEQLRSTRRERNKIRQLEKKQVVRQSRELEEEITPEDEEQLDDLPVEDTDEEENELATAGVKKDYPMGMDMPAYEPPTVGPTSFGELEEGREAQERARDARVITYDVQDLVSNILNNPMMDSGEKSSAIQSVGKDFGRRINAIMSGAAPMQKDMEVLEIEAILAYDKRHSGVLEQLGDIVSKAKLGSRGRENLEDSDFALVMMRDGKKIRKYPIHDKAHVRNALARAAQQIKAGGEGAADARKALPKIRAAAKRMGIEVSMEKDANAIIVQKDDNGDWRWIGFASNKFKDRQQDILSKAAHEEYVSWLDANPDMAPMFMTWHTPGTQRANLPDYWAFEKGFLIFSGKLTEPEAAALLEAKKLADLGMSVKGFGIRDKNDSRVIIKERFYEVSDLPIENAANPFTSLSVLTKEAEMDKQKYLATVMGSEEKAAAFLKKAGLLEEALEGAGIESKENKPAAPIKTEAKTVANKATIKEPDVESLIKRMSEEIDIEGLNENILALNDFMAVAKESIEKVSVLEALVKDLQGDQDEKLAEKINPPVSKLVWARKERASASQETILKKDDKLAQAAPGLGENWLSAATGTVPLQVENQ